MNTIKLLAVAAIAMIGCGDNKTRPDARTRMDSLPADAQCSNCPAAPAVGAQIDRMARPAVNTALNHGFDATAAAQPAKDTYNQDASKANWATNVGEFMINLAMIDALDSGVCGNGRCEAGEVNANPNGTQVACPGDCPTANQVGAGANGCGNQVLYNGNAAGGGAPNAMSYAGLASILSNDELYLDTDKGTCGLYLAVEFGVVTGGSNTTCGGRALDYDVIDFSYSALAAGLSGFVIPGFVPKIKDNAPAHTDYLAAFPYLGPPH